MSAKNKLQRFAELFTLPNVYQNFSVPPKPELLHLGANLDMRGNWAKQHFANQNPITLELACGKAEYSLALARDYPLRNFIGVDLKGNRLWRGAVGALEQGLANAAFIRTQIEAMPMFFAPQEVSEIWITFPDPYLKAAKSDKRLTSPKFLERYQKFLQPTGIIHLKTDDDTLYAFTLETIDEQGHTLLFARDDIYAQPLPYPELTYHTFYEGMHLAKKKTIKYIRFQLNPKISLPM